MKKEKAEDIAVQRVQLLSPLLAAGLDKAKASQIKAVLCEQYGISERTLRRYMARYRKDGFSGLKPQPKGRKPAVAIAEPVLEQAIMLRREIPGRSVRQIIQILEWEGLVKPGEVKRSTLQEKFEERGYSSRQMRMYESTGVAARRFQKQRRMALVQSDIKYGPYLPIGPGGEKKQVYLVLFEDDATRSVLHGEFYASFDQTIVEDCFRKAIQKYGVPGAVYFDQGKQYKTKWMARTCAKLGIRLLFAKPLSPESKGKIERLNRVIDSFLSEAELEKPKTLEQLNRWFDVWLSECYQNKPHASLGGRSPEQAFRGDPHPLRFVEPSVLANAFLHCESRKVDKSGCISFMNKKYEIGLLFIGRTVEVIYDPADITEVTIEYEGHEPWKARELVIGERAGKRPILPEHLQPQPPEASRLLRGAEKQLDQRREQQTPAISFRAIRKEGADHV